MRTSLTLMISLKVNDDHSDNYHLEAHERLSSETAQNYHSGLPFTWIKK